MTRQRQLIAQIIRGSSEHMTAERICELARHEMPGIATGTVYRNLGRMVEDCEIQRISVPDAPDRYDKNTVTHEHLICSRCGRMVDISVEGLDEYISAQSGCTVTGHRLLVRGLCRECAAESTDDKIPNEEETLS